MGIKAASLSRRAVLGTAALAAACGPRMEGLGPVTGQAALAGDALVMPDGYRLRLCSWAPKAAPRAVILALHGFNDHAGAWEIPAPLLTRQGFLLYAYDQRGFGETATRGIWPGTDALVADCRTAAQLIAARHPDLPLVLMGESMGGAVLLAAGAGPAPPRAAAWVLLAPAVWGRATMNGVYRSLLWGASHALPSLSVSGSNPVTRITDDEEVLKALRRDRLLIRETRMDAVAGVVDMMDAATEAAAAFDPGPTMILWAGKDDLIPGSAMQRFVAALPAAPPAVREVRFYPGGYHLLLRDTERTQRVADITVFLDNHLPAPSLHR